LAANAPMRERRRRGAALYAPAMLSPSPRARVQAVAQMTPSPLVQREASSRVEAAVAAGAVSLKLTPVGVLGPYRLIWIIMAREAEGSQVGILRSRTTQLRTASARSRSTER
jgi:hypothetical protein